MSSPESSEQQMLRWDSMCQGFIRGNACVRELGKLGERQATVQVRSWMREREEHPGLLGVTQLTAALTGTPRLPGAGVPQQGVLAVLRPWPRTAYGRCGSYTNVTLTITEQLLMTLVNSNPCRWRRVLMGGEKGDR